MAFGSHPRFTFLLAAAVLGLVASSTQAQQAGAFRQAVLLWNAADYKAAYKGFWTLTNSSAAHARDLDTAYYLLTAGCRHPDPTIVRNSRARIAKLAQDRRGQSLSGAVWGDAFIRAGNRCASGLRPEQPPPDVLIRPGVTRRPTYRPPGVSGVHKTPGGLHMENDYPPLASLPAESPEASLPQEILDLARTDDGTEARAVLEKLIPGRSRVGRYAIVIQADPSANALDIDYVAGEVDRFSQQLTLDFGLPPPEGYFTVVVYSRAAVEGDEVIPPFPASDRFLGVSDARVNSAYVLATGRMRGTVFHELTHLFVENSLGPAAPEWLSEGLASLYEQPEWNGQRYLGGRNFRGHWLRCFPALVPRIDRIITSEWYLDDALLEGDTPFDVSVIYGSLEDAGTMNAAQRYLMRYLQHRGLLRRVVSHYTSLKVSDEGAWPLDERAGQIAEFERATGQSLATLEPQFRAWWRADVAAGTGFFPEIPTWGTPRAGSPNICQRLVTPTW